MDQKKTIKILNNILEKGWLLVFLFSPLVFAVFLNGTWQIAKSLFFQIIVELLLAIWLIKIILKEKINYKAKLKYLLPVIGFFVILSIASFSTKYSFHAFWGDYLRKMGFLLWLHLFLFFIILFFNIKKIKQIKRIAKTIILASLIVAGYGILQFLNLDPLHWSEAPTVLSQGRIFSTLGQPNFLASWLLLSLPLLVWLIVEKGYFQNIKLSLKTIFIRPLLVCLFLFNIIILVLSQSRGGWIGFFVGFFFFTIILSFIINQKRLGILLGILFLIVILFLVYINMSPFYLNKANEKILSYRIKSLSHLLEKGELRLMWWRDSINFIKEKPVFGHGLETQRFYFMKYYRPRSAALEAINSYPDRIHNDILDITFYSGFLGLFFYISLIVLAFYRGVKYIKEAVDKKKKVLALAFMAGILGYLISIQFSFHVIPTAVYFFGYLAILIMMPSFDKKIQKSIKK